MRDLANRGMTMLIVTHEVRFARDVADRVVFMDGGKVVEDSSPQEFFGGTSPRVRQFLNLIET
jgi:cystine transport system ATP-binding protein